MSMWRKVRPAEVTGKWSTPAPFRGTGSERVREGCYLDRRAARELTSAFDP